MIRDVINRLIRFGELLADIATTLLILVVMVVVTAENILTDILRGRMRIACSVRSGYGNRARRRWSLAAAIAGWTIAMMTIAAIGIRLASPPPAGADGEEGWTEPLAMLSLSMAAAISFLILGRRFPGSAGTLFWRLFAVAMVIAVADDVLDLHEYACQAVAHVASDIVGSPIAIHAGDDVVALYVVPIAAGLGWRFRRLLGRYRGTTAMLIVAASLFGMMVECELLSAADWLQETFEAAAAGAILIGVCLALPRIFHQSPIKYEGE